MPEAVGYAHCQYINRVVHPAGKQTAHLKQGLLNFDGTPHTELVKAVTRANKKATTGVVDDTDDAGSGAQRVWFNVWNAGTVSLPA
jgi:hypothetical protein